MENQLFIQNAVAHFGSSTIVVSIDAKQHTDGGYEVFTHSGKKGTGLNPVRWAKKIAEIGVGEIMITSIDREGTMQGLDIQLVQSVTQVVSVPVIASGGVGQLSDFQAGFQTGATAVAAGSIFHFTDQSPIMTRNYLTHTHANVRP